MGNRIVFNDEREKYLYRNFVETSYKNNKVNIIQSTIDDMWHMNFMEKPYTKYPFILAAMDTILFLYFAVKSIVTGIPIVRTIDLMPNIVKMVAGVSSVESILVVSENILTTLSKDPENKYYRGVFATLATIFASPLILGVNICKSIAQKIKYHKNMDLIEKSSIIRASKKIDNPKDVVELIDYSLDKFQNDVVEETKTEEGIDTPSVVATIKELRDNIVSITDENKRYLYINRLYRIIGCLNRAVDLDRPYQDSFNEFIYEQIANLSTSINGEKNGYSKKIGDFHY